MKGLPKHFSRSVSFRPHSSTTIILIFEDEEIEGQNQVVDLTKVIVVLPSLSECKVHLSPTIWREKPVFCPCTWWKVFLSLGELFLLAWECTWAHFKLTEVWLGLKHCLPLGCEEASGVPRALRVPGPGVVEGTPPVPTKLPWAQWQALP